MVSEYHYTGTAAPGQCSGKINGSDLLQREKIGCLKPGIFALFRVIVGEITRQIVSYQRGKSSLFTTHDIR